MRWRSFLRHWDVKTNALSLLHGDIVRVSVVLRVAAIHPDRDLNQFNNVQNGSIFMRNCCNRNMQGGKCFEGSDGAKLKR